ncbi:hypothetical protein G7Y79_00062g093270 [Physcia stellaris]|nr:hypothetical protein G7Y79_00062g093270 [Physcia stellaris]
MKFTLLLAACLGLAAAYPATESPSNDGSFDVDLTDLADAVREADPVGSWTNAVIAPIHRHALDTVASSSTAINPRWWSDHDMCDVEVREMLSAA